MPQTRQLAAIMFTDVVGYTALMGEDEDKAFDILNKNRQIQKPLIEQYNGRWIKELGDGVMASFNTVSDAVMAAIKIQEACNVSKEFLLRIGIHHGEVVFEDNDIFGDVVNIAARIQALAPIGGIWVSESVHNNVSNKKEINTKFVRAVTLKNVKEPVPIYEIVTDASTVPSSRPNKSVQVSQGKKPFITFSKNGGRNKQIIIICLIVLFLSVTVGGYWFFAIRNAKTIASVAVLPFVNKSGNPEIEYLSDGITETLINSLSQLPQLSVKARSSVFRYKGKEVTPQVLGQELDVQAVLNGRMVQQSDQLTLSLDLVDTRTGNQIWGDRYVRKQIELVSMQSEIARDVANKLRPQLPGADKQRVAKTYTADPEANRLYLQGLYYWNKRTVKDLRKSIVFFQQAIDKDPSYAKAYAGLAMAYIVYSGYGRNLTKQELKEVDLKKRAAVRQAMELDDSLAEVHAALATMQEDAWHFADAENEYRRAIELNPNFASAHQFLARLLGGLGRHEEALAEMNKAHELDPFSLSINFSIGGRFRYARHFDEAIAQFKKVLEMEPNHPLSHLVLAWTYDDKGMYPEAISEYRKADVLLEKETPETAQLKAVDLTQSLKTGGARGYWQKRVKYSEKEYNEGRGSAYNIAISYARLGDRDRAFGQLEKSFNDHETDLKWIKTEPGFDSLSSDTRFGDLLRRMGLPK